MSGAVPPPAARPLGRATGVLRPVCPGCGRCGLGDPAPAPQRVPLRAGVARCGAGGRASPGGGAFHLCEGRLRSGSPPPPTARPLGGPLGSATHVLRARVCGCGGPTLSPWPECPVGAACCGGGGGPSPGGLACHCCEGRLVSGAVPPPAARPLGHAARVPRPVCPGCGRCGRGDPAPAPRRAPLRAGVARRGGGGRASPGGVPSAVVRGVWGQALPLPRLPALWAGCRGSLATCCGRGCECVWCVWCLCSACRGAWCRFSLVPLLLPSPVLRCVVVPVVCHVPAVPPSLRASLARLLATPCFVRGFVAPFPFLCSPFSLACTFSLPPPLCVSLSFSSPAFSLAAPCDTKGRVGVCGPLSCIVGTTFVAASRRITYLPSHLCLRVCARSSPFVPYHGVLMSLFPYPHLFVCCLSWCRCTPYAKRDVRGSGPSFFFLPLLPGWFHTFVGLGWWRGPGARCSSRVRGVARHGNCKIVLNGQMFLVLPVLFYPLVCKRGRYGRVSLSRASHSTAQEV